MSNTSNLPVKFSASIRKYRDPPVEKQLVNGIVRKELDKLGYYVELVDYDGMEVFLPITSVTRRKRPRSLAKLVKKDQLQCFLVDNVKDGSILLNLAYVTKENREACKARTSVVNRMCHMGDDIALLWGAYNNMSVIDKETHETLRKNTVWGLFDGFKVPTEEEWAELITQPVKLLTNREFFDDAFVEQFQKNYFNRSEYTPTIASQDFSIRSLRDNGVESIIDALHGVEEAIPEIKISVHKPPSYRFEFSHVDEKLVRSTIDRVFTLLDGKGLLLTPEEVRIKERSVCRVNAVKTIDLTEFPRRPAPSSKLTEI